jgi:hypothetical protein
MRFQALDVPIKRDHEEVGRCHEEVGRHFVSEQHFLEIEALDFLNFESGLGSQFPKY